MNKDQFVDAVCAQFNDFTDPFKDRVNAALPVGISRLGAEYQWEFLDKHVEVTTKTSTEDASGKTRLVLPDDFYRLVVLYTDHQLVEYKNRVAWSEMQMYSPSTDEPTYYTVIGKEMVLSAPSDGSTVYMVYTREADNFDFDDIPVHLQYVVMAAVLIHLAPKDMALQEAYHLAVRAAAKIESRKKGRQKEIMPPRHIVMRWNHT